MISALDQDNKTLQLLTLPVECEPIEFNKTILMKKIRKSGRIQFVSKTTLFADTIAHTFASLDIWPYQ